jgi:Protein of unknown function (DUF3455)
MFVNHIIRLRRLLTAGIVAAAAVAATAHVAQAALDKPEVPSAIAVPEDSKLFLVGHAVGVQVYSCDLTSNGFRWAFAGPKAEVYDNHGKLIMTHFGGPSWQARDGSVVVGRKDAGITVDPTAIEWLRVAAASTSAGPGGGDQLVNTAFIQRIATTGGLQPPAAQCNVETAGTRAEIPYTADYYFWKVRGD